MLFSPPWRRTDRPLATGRDRHSSAPVGLEVRSMPPQTSYARSGELSIAYQVVGDGPVDLVATPGFVSHLEYHWEEPSLARYYRRLAAFARLIVFDKRGTGMSDRVPPADLP